MSLEAGWSVGERAVREIHPAKDLLILSYSWASDDIMNIKQKIGHKKLIRNVPG